ncbi:APC family permease [Mucilaginibacter sp. 14171R-50]|uniref:APC family permease n=1 Tax=Mucilaginibacter sp. 14171R-50 TaxID=2703789 RepID=UPI00138BD842|nr:APC family permease [Mucilaginibacter sp. 14171R-50]QHS56405.1 APC family permease [Mucilaginibacter sp. 14171R-50]
MSTKNITLHKLNELQATAISGNDISSSCLYVSALTIAYAGQYAWISLLVVALVLFLFRKIYGEVVGALPLNGGAYNVLLNTASKRTASFAACLTILSYMATAVISAYEAMFYFHDIVHDLPLIPATIMVLVIFMMLTIIGIGESAFIAVIIFITHIVSLVLLVLAACWFVIQHGTGIFLSNWHLPVTSGGVSTALFLGFSAAMLGISGFESSANFVEEQKPGVFPKTLRNMWGVVSFFNPVIALLALAVLPMADISGHQESLLSFMGEKAGGSWLSHFIVIDAVLVLSGAVLTSYVGVTGLAERITLDRILPNFFLAQNRRGVNYRIVIGFFLLCVSILLVTKADLASLAGVYTFSFLLVMALFGVGNLLLKVKREKLPRPERATVISVIIAIGFIVAAFLGNMRLNLPSFYVFIQYLIPTVLFILVMLNRARVTRWLIYAVSHAGQPLQRLVKRTIRPYRALIKLNSQELVFFTRGDNVAILNRVMIYVEENEATKRLKIVHIANEDSNNDHLKKDIEVLDRAYPDIDIDFVEIEGRFGPEMIDQLSKEWNIPKNFMFIGAPGNKFPYHVSELGGVRLIM